MAAPCSVPSTETANSSGKGYAAPALRATICSVSLAGEQLRTTNGRPAREMTKHLVTMPSVRICPDQRRRSEWTARLVFRRVDLGDLEADGDAVNRPVA